MTLTRPCDMGLYKSIGWFDAFSDLAKTELDSHDCRRQPSSELCHLPRLTNAVYGCERGVTCKTESMDNLPPQFCAFLFPNYETIYKRLRSAPDGTAGINAILAKGEEIMYLVGVVRASSTCGPAQRNLVSTLSPQVRAAKGQKTKHNASNPNRTSDLRISVLAIQVRRSTTVLWRRSG